jgi:hypothetical protein
LIERGAKRPKLVCCARITEWISASVERSSMRNPTGQVTGPSGVLHDPATLV